MQIKYKARNPKYGIMLNIQNLNVQNEKDSSFGNWDLRIISDFDIRMRIFK
jgi:hypothetical protein